MVEENQKLPEPSDMELGSDINAGQFCGAPPEVLGRRLHHVMQKWLLQKLRLWERKRAMVVLTPQESLHACSALDKSMSDI